MACISELAYLKFNPLFKNTNKHDLVKLVANLIDDSQLKSLNFLIDAVSYDSKEELEKLEYNSDLLKFNLG